MSWMSLFRRRAHESPPEGIQTQRISFTVACSFCKADQRGAMRWFCNDCKSPDYNPTTSTTWETLLGRVRGDCSHCQKETTGCLHILCDNCSFVVDYCGKSRYSCTEEETNAIKGRMNMECDVCTNTFPSTEMRSPPCGHFFSSDCWKHYFCTVIENRLLKKSRSGFFSIKCMEKGCQEIIEDPHFIRDLLGPDHRDKYELMKEIGCRQSITRLFCCPVIECSQIFEIETNKSVISCAACGVEICLNCNYLSHPGQSCRPHSISFSGSEYVKPCPRCKTPIDKEPNSCNFLRCWCGHQFCWLCGKDWPGDFKFLGRNIPAHALRFRKNCSCPNWGRGSATM